MTTVIVPGIPERQPSSTDLGRGLPAGTVKTKHAVRIEAARAGAARARLDDVEDHDVVEIEFEDGLRLWSRADDLERDFGIARARGAEDAIELPGMLPIGGPSRGAAGWAIKALKVIGIDPPKTIADFVARHVEGQLRPGPGLYRCSDADAADLTPVSSLDGAGPTLVFLHGTASSTAGSFGGLWTGDRAAPIRRLFERYDGRVLALQHETLTRSPIENALAVARQLVELRGSGAEIHLVSHSRGGLVGELLARGMRIGSAPFTDDELELFAEREHDRRALQALNEALQRAQFAITRFVRVGCPARGTTLADGRLDRYFSILVNLVGFIPGLKANPIYDGLTSLLAGVLRQRTSPDDLPGLEAQMPGSPLVLMLNRPGVRTGADLHVLGGDLEGAGFLGRLKTFATDLFYLEDHDLVVNTPSMLGGAERAGGVRYWIDTGAEVTHFQYFSRSDTATRLVAALTGGPADFRTLEAKPFTVTANDYRKRALVPQPVVFVLPGIMGSELSIGQTPVWLDLFALATGGLARLETGVAAQASGLVYSAYGDLCRNLAATHEVVPFPYDWRLSIETSAEALRAALDKKLPQAEADEQPIRLLAHSMGGLVVRAMLATPAGQATWKRMCRHPGARFIMLGTPNGGSHAIPAMLIGRDGLVKKLALLDFKHDYAGLLGTIAAFQGVLDLLPGTGTLDLFDAAKWRELHARDVPADRGLFSSSVASSKSAGFAWTLPADAGLTRARALRDLIAASPLDPARMIYVAGVAEETACDIVVDETARAGRRVRVMASAHGDGRVLWKTGIPSGLRAYFMDAAHGDLASTEEAFPALVDLLTTGTTSRLPTSAPQRRAAVTDTFEMREPVAVMVPDQDDIVTSAVGGRRRRTRRAQAPPVRVRVVHDDLSRATAPVLVGHYRQDVIIGAERYLDRQLAGRLTELHRMDLYPGAIGTAAAVLNIAEQARGGQHCHPGAIVAGLGAVGDLTPGGLTTTLAQALTTYGAECVERERRRRQREGDVETGPATIPAPVTALLVGSGEAGVSVANAVQALLRAVVLANSRLQLPKGRGAREAATLSARIDHVDLVELYEDRAIEAAHALRDLARSAELEGFAVEDILVRGTGGQRRARYEMARDWWQRIRVTTEGDGGLRFEALTQLARVNASLRPTQRRAVDAFLKRATTSTAFEPALGSTLFEMLVPNDFKTHAPDRRNLVLVLDTKAAAIPWELLDDRYDPGARPISVMTGMVRQLIVGPAPQELMRATGTNAFVLGNPLVSDPRFPALPGAAREADAVARTLTDRGYDVTSLLGEAATPMAVLTALHARPWRIVHLAAHGVFEFTARPDEPPVSGLVLDDGVFFTAADAQQIRFVPDLVFINCCHLGQTAGEAPLFTAFTDLAANLGTEFIKMGVRAVVAAGWAVDDAAATTFAQTVYGEMLAGQPFGEAVVRGRQRVFQNHGTTNTWGAYQCYGDPGFALVPISGAAREEPPVSDQEVSIRADQIARSAAAADDRERAELIRDLDALVATVPEAWWSLPTLCAAVAGAYGELRHFEAAIGYYEKVAVAEQADAPVKGLEQLANLRVRWARSLARRDAGSRDAALQQLAKAERMLESLLVLGETAERYSLLGSLNKRRAMLVEDAHDRARALDAMRRAYAAAYEIAKKRPRGGARALANRLAAEVVQSWRPGADDGDAARSLESGLATYGELAAELGQTSTDFFDLCARADHLLLLGLRTRTLAPSAIQEIRTHYLHACLRGVSPRHRASARDQLTFFEEMIRAALADAEGQALAAAVAHLGQSLD